MQRAGTAPTMSAAGHERLRARLRAEANATRERTHWLAWFKRPLVGRLVLATAAGLVCFVMLSWVLTRKQAPQVIAATLSPAVLKQAAEEHELCAHFYANSPEPSGMATAAVEYDAAYAGLDRIAKLRAEGMQLHAAHKCDLIGRNFAHLLFSRGSDLISVLVTERDAAAMKDGAVPQDDGSLAGLQQTGHAGCTIHAYQTSRHVVFTVSKLSVTQNQALAERIAAPISEHLRKIAPTK